jgi:hypothetical protein
MLIFLCFCCAVKQLEMHTDALADERARAKETELRNEAERAAASFRERQQVRKCVDLPVFFFFFWFLSLSLVLLLWC